MKSDLLVDTKYDFVRMFKKGKQGLTGLLRDKETGETCVFKMSQHIDYVCEHEETIARRLNELRCPVFSKILDSRVMKINPDSRASHPFEFCENPTERLVLFFEYVRGYSLSKVIKSKHSVDTSVIQSTVKIVLLAVKMAYDNVKFTHYDLHTSNILMKKCDKNLRILFKFNDKNIFSVPTHGWMPIIIDYGFAYVDKIDSGPMYQSLAHTNVGFISCAADPFADAKLFLASVSSHAFRYRKAKSILKLRKLFKNIFGKLDMDFDCGWDVNDDSSIADEVLNYLASANKRKRGVISDLFNRYDHFATDLMGSLVMLPLETNASSPTSYDSDDDDDPVTHMRKTYKIFLKQFSKIENVVKSSFTRIQILKILVDEARLIMADYYDPRAQKHASYTFKREVIAKIDAVAKLVDLSKINFEKILCSLLLFARGLEIYLARKLNCLLNKKQSEYISKLSVENTVEIVGAIELKIKADKAVTRDSQWLIVEPFKQEKRWNPRCEHIDLLNDAHPLVRGTKIGKIMIT
jgi:serine/threonine protein kinase